METDMLNGRLNSAQIALDFILAGNSTFTIRSVRTEKRFTYRVRKCEDKPGLSFVSLLNGSDNESSFTYLGTIRDANYALGRKSKVDTNTPSHIAFQWFWSNVTKNQLPSSVECWHEGRCGKCNRKLTVPESIERGIGPECVKSFVSQSQPLLLAA